MNSYCPYDGMWIGIFLFVAIPLIALFWGLHRINKDPFNTKP